VRRGVDDGDHAVYFGVSARTAVFGEEFVAGLLVFAAVPRLEDPDAFIQGGAQP
jgi:hypothetical protein